MHFPPPFEVSLEKLARAIERLRHRRETELTQTQLESEHSTNTHEFSQREEASSHLEPNNDRT